MVRDKRDGDSVRLEIADLEDKPNVITLELDLEFWPTQELRLGPEGWQRSPVRARSAQRARLESTGSSSVPGAVAG